MSQRITFFSKEKKSKKLLKGDQHRRQIVITLLESSEPLSKPQIANRTDASYGFVYDSIDELVKAGVLKPLVEATHKARKDSKYELTDAGKIFAFAVSVDEKRVIGKKAIELKKIFQPERGSDPLNFFVRSVLLNGLHYGLERYVLEFLRDLVEEAEISSNPDLWKLAQDGLTEAKASELNALNKSVIKALDGLDEFDKDTVVQYYRNMTIQRLFDKSIQSRDKELQSLARESQRDPDGIYLPFQCKKCQYSTKRLYLKMENVIVEVFSKRLLCPKCHRLVHSGKKNTQIMTTNPYLQNM